MFNAWLKEAGLGGQALITANSPQGAWLNLQPKSAFSLLLSYGIGTKRLGSKIYVDQVLEQSAASRAGIKRGDRLVSDQALLATECTLSRCKLALQKSPNASIQNLSLKAEPKSLGELLYGDAEKSDRIYAVPTELSHQTLKIGYTRLLGTDFPHRNELLQSIGRRMQDQADIWLLDLRGGIPSGSEDLSRWFFYQEKDGKKSDPIFSKPLAIIVDDSTAGDRERLALVVQQQNRGVIIGTRSMGRPWPVTVRQIDQSPFWLAWPEELQTQDLSLLPDYELKAELAYAGGHDAILERSLLILAQLEISRDKSAREKPAKLPAKKQQ